MDRSCMREPSGGLALASLASLALLLLATAASNRPLDALDGLGPPLRDEDYWDFVSQVASRYYGRVAAYQIWNEPNLNSEWGRRPPDAAAYLRLLRGASERIHSIDPSAQVVLAAMAPT